MSADDALLVPPMLLVTADEMFWAIQETFADHDWFSDWASINEAAALAVQVILNVGPPTFLLEPVSPLQAWVKTQSDDSTSSS